jgi:hypothetical protein
MSMRNNVWEISNIEQTSVLKTAFLSYYISLYNAVSKEIGYDDSSITVDEIFDFIQDLKHEGRKEVPNISKEDISYCFHVLHMSGVCKP